MDIIHCRVMTDNLAIVSLCKDLLTVQSASFVITNRKGKQPKQPDFQSSNKASVCNSSL